jgi:Fe-S-cluster containining protein
METDQKKNLRVNDKAAGRNVCMRCGACCIAFQVSFYWAEGDDISAGGVPVDKTVKVNNFRRAMRHARFRDRRCIALHGEPGRSVKCTIHKRRPSVCRNFEPSWKKGIHNPLCDKARADIGLEPLSVRGPPKSVSSGSFFTERA